MMDECFFVIAGYDFYRKTDALIDVKVHCNIGQSIIYHEIVINKKTDQLFFVAALKII